MDLSIAKNAIQVLIKQRNAFIILTIILLISNIILASLLFYKDEKIIILPAIETKLEFSNKFVSESYIEEISYFLAYYLFNINAENIEKHHNIVKNYVDNSIIQLLYNYYQNKQNYHKEYGSNQYFTIEELYIDGYEVLIKGTENITLAKNQKLENKKAYKFKFGLNARKLRLIKFQEVEYVEK